ncbi:hypothetical protein [Foetidibacter luteolus]|uniref:hypothetical protein n=1 Tax=Foetidibacter luteolus TaxID=2608880 RepID=UPI00129B9FD2|nr:hypothetical protein [Foetidibacter luteolus]
MPDKKSQRQLKINRSFEFGILKTGQFEISTLSLIYFASRKPPEFNKHPPLHHNRLEPGAACYTPWRLYVSQLLVIPLRMSPRITVTCHSFQDDV